METSSRKDRKDLLWDLLVALRLYLIVLFIILPISLLTIFLNYLQPLSLIILGFSVLLIIRFVLFETRKSSNKFLKCSLITLFILMGLVFFNFFFGFILQIVHFNPIGIITPLDIA